MICASNVGSKILKKVKFIEKLQGRQADLIDGKQMESKNITMMDLTQRNNIDFATVIRFYYESFDSQ
jgi:hypothetical protein